LRKKSHYWAGKLVVSYLDAGTLSSHRKAFILGNILPDVKPSFVYRKHEYTKTVERLKKSVDTIARGTLRRHIDDRVYWRRTGEILHFVADYFTYPHNKEFKGGFMQHNAYEQQLKLYFKRYVKSGRALKEVTAQPQPHFQNIDEIFDYIADQHDLYRKKGFFSVESDAEYIARMCCQVAQGVWDVYVVRCLRSRRNPYDPR